MTLRAIKLQCVTHSCGFCVSMMLTYLLTPLSVRLIHQQLALVVTPVAPPCLPFSASPLPAQVLISLCGELFLILALSYNLEICTQGVPVWSARQHGTLSVDSYCYPSSPAA